MPPPTPEEMAAMGAVQVMGANGQPTWTTPDAATRLGLTPVQSAPAPEPVFAPGSLAPAIPQAAAPEAPAAPAAPALVTQTRAAPTFETQGGFTMGGADVAPASPVRTETQQRIAGQEAATARARALVDAPQAAPAPGAPNISSLAQRAAGGDPEAAYSLGLAAQNGDADAQRALEQINLGVQMGVLNPGQRSGGGGPLVTQTATTSMTQAGRAPTEEEAAGLDAARQAADDAERRQIDAMTAQAESEASALRQGAERMQRAQVDLDAMREDQETAQRARQAQLASRERELDGVLRDVGSRRVEADNLFAKGNTRNRFSAAIGMSLAGLGDAIAGTNNGMSQVMGIINGAVNADIEAQRANIANASSNASQRKGLLADMRARFGSEEAAESAAKAAMLEDAARQVRALQATAQGDQRTAQLAQLLAQIDAQKAAAQQQAIVAGLGTTQIERVEQRRSGGGGTRRPAINFAAAIPEEGEVTPGERETLNVREQAAIALNRNIQRARDLVGQTSRTGPLGSIFPGSSGESRELTRILSGIADEFVKVQMGAANPEQVVFVEDRRGLTPATYAEDLETILGGLERDAQETIARARLGVSAAAVSENQQRAPGVRAEVAREFGAAEDLIPGARRVR